MYYFIFYISPISRNKNRSTKKKKHASYAYEMLALSKPIISSVTLFCCGIFSSSVLISLVFPLPHSSILNTIEFNITGGAERVCVFASMIIFLFFFCHVALKLMCCCWRRGSTHVEEKFLPSVNYSVNFPFPNPQTEWKKPHVFFRLSLMLLVAVVVSAEKKLFVTLVVQCYEHRRYDKCT